MSDPFVGEIRTFGFSFAPRNWAKCDGQLLSVSQNTALFSLLGTTYGGDGRTTFGLPDLRGRVSLHQGSGPGLLNRPIGQRAGTQTNTLSTSQLPSHGHAANCVSGAGNTNVAAENVWSKDAAGGTFGHLRLMSVAACHLLITNSIPQMFPTLRWGFIEASSQWIPYMVHDLRRRLETRGRTLGEFPLKDHNIWVTCQTDDDLPYVLKYSGEDQILVGTDYGHQDQSSEIEAMRVMREDGDVEPRIIDKIMGENAVKFYGL